MTKQTNQASPGPSLTDESLLPPPPPNPEPAVDMGSAPPKPTRIAVKATRKGWYGNQERVKGARFYIAKESDFSETWMKRADKEEQEADRGAFPTVSKRLRESDLKNTAPSK